LAARHPDRVTALTVMVGAAPLLPEERGALLGANRAGFEAAQQGWYPLYGYLEQMRQRILSGGGVRALLGDAPAEDLKIVDNPLWQRIDRANSAEALRQGAQGWADETLALLGTWDFRPRDLNKRDLVAWSGRR
jgi:pimeloyl-ACP methyl ester carboxylesterase